MNKERVQKTGAPFLAFIVYTGLTFLFFNELILGVRWLRDDFFFQNFPNRFYAAVEISRWNIPLWNPFTFSGMPFLADIQTAVLYPFNLLLSIFVENNAIPYEMVEYQLVCHFVIAAMFMYFFLKSLELDFLSSLLGGILFAFNGFLINHTHHTNIIHSSVWLPALLTCCNYGFKRDTIWFWLCPIVLTISLLGGHPQITLFILYLFTLYYFYLSITYRRHGTFLKSFYIYIIMIILFLLLSSVQLLPTMEFLQHTVRKVLAYKGAIYDSLDRKLLLSLFMSDIFNNDYGYWKHWEYRFYMSIGGIVLSMFGLLFALGRINLFFLLVSLVALTLSLGGNTPVYKIFYDIVPGFQFFRVPARFTFIFLFSASVMSAYGFSMLSKTKQSDEKILLKIALLFGFFCIAIPLTAYLLYPEALSSYKKHFTGYMIISIGSISSIYLALKFEKTKTFIRVLLLLLIVADLFLYRGIFNQVKMRKQDVDQTIHHSPVSWILKNEPEGARFLTKHRYQPYANLGLIYRKSNLWGYNPFKLKIYDPINVDSPATYSLLGAKYFDYAEGDNRHKDKKRVVGFVINEKPMARQFFVSNYKIDPTFDLQKKLNKGEFDPLKVVYLESAFDKFGTEEAIGTNPGYSVIHYKNSGDEIAVGIINEGTGFLVLSEIYYPGWKALVNGEQRDVMKANSLFRAVYLEDGINEVKLLFQPLSFTIGRILSLSTLSLMLLFFLYMTRRSGHQKGQNTDYTDL